MPKMQKARSVLIVTEAFILGGMETRIIDEIKALRQNGFIVFLATDLSRLDERVLSETEDIQVLSLSLSNGFDASALISSIDALRSIISQKKIGIIHAHGFHSGLASAVAAQLEGTRFMLSIHGPATYLEANTVARLIFKHLIFPRACRVNCVSKEIFSLVRSFCADTAQVLPNYICQEKFSAEILSPIPDQRWAIISRLSKEKLAGIASFIEYAHRAGIPGVVVIGDGPAQQELIAAVDRANLNDYIEFRGPTYDVAAEIGRFSGVAGVGRVILEAISCRRAACVIGYGGGVKGIVTTDNFKRFQFANFSGRNMPTITVEQFKASLGDTKNNLLDALHQTATTEHSSHRWINEINEYHSLPTDIDLAAIDFFYASLCYYHTEVSFPFWNSDIFLSNIMIPTLQQRTIHSADAALDINIIRSGDYCHKSSSPIKAVSIDTTEQDSAVIAAITDENITANTPIHLNISQDSGFSRKHRVTCDYLITSSTPLPDRSALLSVKLKAPTGELPEAIAGLVKSQDPNIGFFRYLDISTGTSHQSFEFHLPAGVVIAGIDVIPWRVDQTVNLHIHALRLVSVHI